MAIKFGDELINQNSSYPIVDATGNNIAGIYYVADFTGTLSIPAAFHKKGTVLVDESDGGVYVWTGADDDTDINDTTNSGWKSVGSGAALLGSSQTWDDNSPAVSLTDSNTIAYAIDQLNETLGALVPTAPQGFSAIYSTLSWDNVSTNTARLVQYQSDGATAITHATNGNTVTLSAGDEVNWFQSTNFAQGWSSVSDADWDENDLLKTQFTFSVSAESVQLSDSNDLTETLLATNNDNGGNMVITVTHDGFPISGDSADFYTGVRTIDVSCAATLVDGYHLLRFTDGTNHVDKAIYREANSTNISSASRVLTMTTDGTIAYSSGIPHFTTPTWKVAFDCSNIVPAGALVYGATTSSSTYNKWADGNSGTIVAAPTDQVYNDITGVTNTSVKQGLGVTGYEITGVSTISGKYGAYTFNSGTNGPRITFQSIHGNESNSYFTTSSTATHLFLNTPTNTSSLRLIVEDDLYNELNGSAAHDGVRVGDPDQDGTYVDTPSDASTSFTAWSRQYANGAAALDIDPQDAIVRAYGSSGIRLLWDDTNYTGSGFEVPGTAPSGVNFSTRSGSDAQYATFKFPCTQSGLQFIHLGFKGLLQSTGEVWVKIFDTTDAQSIVDNDTTSGQNGWLKATTTPTTVNGLPTVGCSYQGSLSKTSTSFQDITLNAGFQRWGNGNDGHVYVRIKLQDGGYVEQLAMSDTSF